MASNWMPGAKVVKALHTIFAGRHSSPTEDVNFLDAFLEGE